MNNIEKFEDFLDRMQGLLDKAKKQGHIIVRVEDLENTFPELKESEDERIRKWIIGVLLTYEHDRDLRNAAIDWLKKQGQVKESQISQYESKTCKENDDSLISEDDRIRKDIIISLKHSGIKPDRPINPHVRTTMKDALAWLEKQGEHVKFTEYK